MGENIDSKGNYMQPEAPDLLSLKMKMGNKMGLQDMNSIFLSETTAQKLFGSDNPIDKLVKNRQ